MRKRNGKCPGSLPGAALRTRQYGAEIIDIRCRFDRQSISAVVRNLAISRPISGTTIAATSMIIFRASFFSYNGEDATRPSCCEGIPVSSMNRTRSRRFRFGAACVLGFVFLAGTVPAAPQTETNEATTPSGMSTEEVIRLGLKYLATEGQAEDGTFSAKAGPGITALALTAALRNGQTLDAPLVKKGLAGLENFVRPDGGIYGDGRLKNYETCVAMLCFKEANRDGRYDEVLKRAEAFVTKLQYGAADGDADDLEYGGASYGGRGRPDLSNTAYLVEALHAMDSGSDEAVQRALVFISRCQNLEGPHNDTPFAAKVNDGGFYYVIPTESIDPSTSSERFTPNGGLRSYGSMTYAGLKSMVYAGLTEKDPRVKAARDWIEAHYAVDENPGMGSSGLYYYFHTFAAALDASGLNSVQDAEGTSHDWQKELALELAQRQNKDGSWSNENARWFENDKNLATSFALLALSHCSTPDRAVAETSEAAAKATESN